MLHHVEIWVADLDRAIASLGWLLQALGYTPFQSWDAGRVLVTALTTEWSRRDPAAPAGPGLNYTAKSHTP
jgi:hypothetical protein